jgi:hypothetical protein
MTLKHGTHSYYSKGCRCEECRLAHRIYERNAKRRRTHIQYGFISPEPKFVDAGPTREHIHFLRGHGIGLGTIAKNAGVHRSNVQRIVRGQQARVSLGLEKRVLAIPSLAIPENKYVSTEPLKALLEQLNAKGIRNSDVARFLGYKNQHLQLKTFVRLYRFKKIEAACQHLLRSHRD